VPKRNEASRKVGESFLYAATRCRERESCVARDATRRDAEEEGKEQEEEEQEEKEGHKERRGHAKSAATRAIARESFPTLGKFEFVNSNRHAQPLIDTFDPHEASDPRNGPRDSLDRTRSRSRVIRTRSCRRGRRQ